MNSSEEPRKNLPRYWSIQQPILVAAPHLMFPARNGADISVERLARYLSSYSEYVDLIGCNTIRRYNSTEIVSEERYHNSMRGKMVAAIRTLLNRTHYLHERFLTRAALKVLNAQLCANPGYGTIVASYFVTLAVLPKAPRVRRIVLTHNDEFKWFEDIAERARNPIGRSVASQSLRWLHREVPRLSKDALFVHFSERDSKGYDRVVTNQRAVITSVGTDIDEDTAWPNCKHKGPIVLSFLGSLSVAMAFDALRHFQAKFEPALRGVFGQRLEIRVIGSGPTRAIRALCRKAGWILHGDVSDAVLCRLLNTTTFTILPFAYSTGVKLKLIRSLGSGVPFLSTTASRMAAFVPPTGCCVSDEAEDWVAAVRSWISIEDPGKVRRILLETAREHSWPKVVSRLVHSLE